MAGTLNLRNGLATMARMKDADLITEHLVRNKIPYVFGKRWLPGDLVPAK